MDYGFWSREYYHNTIASWAIALGIILGAVIIGKILYWLSGKIIKKLTQKTKSKLDDILVEKLEEPIVWTLILLIAQNTIKLNLTFPDEIFAVINNGFHFAITIVITWMIARTVNALIVEYAVPLTKKSESDFDDQLLPILQKGLRIIIWSLGVIIALNNAGYNVTTILAGLGIGGLAFALAAQDTIKNIFGGAMIFIDKPFKLNDRIKIKGFDGFVHEIGIRSTRLRTLEGRIVTMPNAVFSDEAVENVSIEPSRKIILDLGLTYDTSPEQMEEGIKILKEIANDHRDKIEENVLVAFDAYGHFSLGLKYIYYISKESDIFNTQTAINLDILRRFNAKGLEFAFPTQTIYKKEM
ncbi:mechanosensitive ion channel family protein [Draconibacterium sp.]